MPKVTYKEQFNTEPLVNIVEELVFEELHALISADNPDICTCELCILDMAAVLLNTVPPLYSSSPVERISPSAEFVEAVENRRRAVHEALPETVAKVAERSHH